MLIFLLLFHPLCTSLTLTKIPSSGTPPQNLAGSSAVYSTKTNTIITTGGQLLSETQIFPDIWKFNLTSKTWSSPLITSQFIPTGMRRHRAYLRSDNKILIFGVYKEILIYDLEDDSWSSVSLLGAQLHSIYSFGFTSFQKNNSEYVAIFGGSSLESYKNSLFL